MPKAYLVVTVQGKEAPLVAGPFFATTQVRRSLEDLREDWFNRSVVVTNNYDGTMEFDSSRDWMLEDDGRQS